jgi:hypothetical protein
VPFRRLQEPEQYRKFDWLECDLRRSPNDPRPESHHPMDLSQFVPVGHMGTESNWRARRKLLLETAPVFTRMADVIEGAKANQFSLAVFKPARIERFVVEQEERHWDAAKLAEMRHMHQQGELFAEEPWRQTFEVIEKLPYSFSYAFTDADGRLSELQILDWEIGALFWNCVRSCGGDEAAAITKVKAKYVDEFASCDLHFFLGTTQRFHLVGPNPWVIIGVFYVPHERQLELF